MKKNILIVVLFVFFVMVVSVLMLLEEPKIGKFNLNNYQYYIENFSSNENIGNTSDLREVLLNVEKLWIEMYGESVKNERPYKVFYDSINDVWLVQGSLKSNSMGGVANVLIEKSTGRVLAIWHDK